MPGVQPDAAGTVEIGGRGHFLNLKFFRQPLKHIIKTIRAKANVVCSCPRTAGTA